jgi:hypothetical protein
MPASRRVCRSDAAGNFGAALAFDYGDVVLALQVQPKLGAVAEVPSEADGGISRDRAPSVQNIRDAARWNPNIEREPVGA